MVKSKISEIANTIELGENRGFFGVNHAEIKAGQVVRQVPGSRDLIELAGSSEEMGGVLDMHYDVALDAGIPSGYSAHPITQGNVAVFVENPGADKDIGVPLFDGAGTAGSLAWAAGGSIVGHLAEECDNGDTVAIVKLVK